jgi:hypothetical protein
LPEEWTAGEARSATPRVLQNHNQGLDPSGRLSEFATRRRLPSGLPRLVRRIAAEKIANVHRLRVAGDRPSSGDS